MTTSYGQKTFDKTFHEYGPLQGNYPNLESYPTLPVVQMIDIFPLVKMERNFFKTQIDDNNFS